MAKAPAFVLHIIKGFYVKNERLNRQHYALQT
jgi:hypothetical protein